MATGSPYTPVRQVYPILAHQPLVVCDEDGAFLGLLKLEDVVLRPRRVAIDAMRMTESVSDDMDPMRLLHIMPLKAWTVITVLRGQSKSVVGLVYYEDLARQLGGISYYPAELFNSVVNSLKEKLQLVKADLPKGGEEVYERQLMRLQSMNIMLDDLSLKPRFISHWVPKRVTRTMNRLERHPYMAVYVAGCLFLLVLVGFWLVMLWVVLG